MVIAQFLPTLFEVLAGWAGQHDIPGAALRRILGMLEAAAAGRVEHLTDGQRPQFYIAGLRAQAWWSNEEFEWMPRLHEAAQLIVGECATIGWRERLRHHPEPQLVAGDWNILPLFDYGRKNKGNCDLLPVTTQLIEAIPTASTACLVYLSSLAPKSWIKPHCGPTNCRLRCHFAITVPPGCRIRVGPVTRAWEPGTGFVFDDSFEHEVRNDGTERRDVLIFDIWHPELSAVEQGALTVITKCFLGAGILNDR